MNHNYKRLIITVIEMNRLYPYISEEIKAYVGISIPFIHKIASLLFCA